MASSRTESLPRVRKRSFLGRRVLAGAVVITAIAGVLYFVHGGEPKPSEIRGSAAWARKYYGKADAPNYRDRHIVEMNFLGEPMYVNKAVVPHFLRLAQIFEDKAPDYAAQITAVHDDWSYKNRDIRGGSTKSMHSFGIALDINALSNALGTDGDMPQAVVDAWEAEGGAWGGNFSRPDPMHFESHLTPAEIKVRYEPDGTPKN